MTHEETMELCAILMRQLLDAAALNYYYATLLTEQPRAWKALSKMERDHYTERALKQAQTVFLALGWQMDIQDLKAMARS